MVTITEEEDKAHMQKHITIDYRSLASAEYVHTVIQGVTNKVTSQIADEYLAEHSSDILASLDPKIIANLVKVTIAKKIQEDHDQLMSILPPDSHSMNELNKRHRNRMDSILNKE